MFGTILLTSVTLMQAYVFWRAASVPLLARMPRYALIASGLALWAIFVAARTVEHDGTGRHAAVLELFGLSWMGAVFLTALCVLAVDLVTGFGFLLPRLAPRLRGGALAMGGALSLVALVQGTRPPVIEHHTVHLPGLPAALDGTVVVALSDTHLGAILGPRWLEARARQVEALRPDLVVLLGDVFEGHGLSDRSFLPGLRQLTAPLGVLAVPGNHDMHRGGDGSMPLLAEAGHQVLRNGWAEVRPGLVVAGVDDLTRWRRRKAPGDPLGPALEGRPAGATLLLSHSPLEAERAAAAGVNLMLSGHTHGGQLWPFGYLVRRAYPLLAGRYEVDGMTVLVCRGTGTWGPRMRLWRPAELLQVTLRAAP